MRYEWRLMEDASTWSSPKISSCPCVLGVGCMAGDERGLVLQRTQSVIYSVIYIYIKFVIYSKTLMQNLIFALRSM